MTYAAQTSSTLDLLTGNNLRKDLIQELNRLRSLGGSLTADKVSIVLGQWYHPLHYFPVFLSRLISVSPDLERQTHISRILWQELGEGDDRKSHERIYISTMVDAGHEKDSVSRAKPFDNTDKLVAGYKQASEDYLSGLGFLYGTEVADLAMVSTIGKLVRQSSGMKELPWVDIHVNQEPDHVESSTMTLIPPVSAKEQKQIVSSAERMWTLWINFFHEIRMAIS